MAETGEVVTYRQLDDRSNRIAHLFRDRGLGPGSTVALVMGNDRRFLETAWAAQRSGLTYVPVNWHLTAEEMSYIVGDSDARLIVASADHADLAETLLDDVPNVEAVLLTSEVVGRLESLDAVAASFPAEPIHDERLGADMIYSSGTTGRPKGGRRPRRNVHPADVSPRVLEFFQRFDLDHDSVYLSPGAPLYHGAPLRFVMAVLTMGGTAVIMDHFDAEAALEALSRYRITHSQWVPTMFVRMLRLPESLRSSFDLSSHRVAIHSAAPCPIAIKDRMLAWWGPIIHEYYGGSEGGALTAIGPEEWLAHKGSVGRPALGRVHIVDDDGNALPSGETGLVAFEGGVPIEYHKDPDKTLRSHTSRGWSTVGDVGYLDNEGYLYLTDRKDFTIVAGGVNIYPNEIEEVLGSHPGVADVAVFGVPNEEYGEEVKAVVEPVVLQAENADLERELRELCERHLAAYKRPRSFEFLAELPRSPAGKLYKRRLRDVYWEAHASRVV